VTGTRSAESARRSRFGSATLWGWIALLAVWFGWGSTYDAIRVGVRTIPPFTLAASRYLVAGAVLLPLAARGIPAVQRPFRGVHWRSAAIIGALLLFAGNGLLSVGERTLPAGVAALLVATVPLWMVVFGAVLDRRMFPPTVGVGLALGLIGVAVLVDPLSNRHVDLVGAATVLIASIAWAAGSLYARSAPQPQRPLLATGMQMICGGAVLAVAAVATGEWRHWGTVILTPAGLLALAWLIVPGSLIAFSAYGYTLRTLPTATVSTYAFVNPIVAVLIGWPLLGEQPTLPTAVATGIIVLAVALILYARFHASQHGGNRRVDADQAESRNSSQK
jgi:drug/metabolite transporter (DMT)-like permease